MPSPDEDLEWIVRLALESRRRFKKQQKRIFKSEFQNTHFSYTFEGEGMEQFVSIAASRMEGWLAEVVEFYGHLISSAYIS